MKFQFELYGDSERRASLFDRRNLDGTRSKVHKSSQFVGHQPDGRRYTDREIKVDQDKSRVSMLQYYARNPDLLER